MPLVFHHPQSPADGSGAVRRAWLRYLEETRRAAPGEYAEVEERAWRRLVGSLVALGEPLDLLEPPAE